MYKYYSYLESPNDFKTYSYNYEEKKRVVLWPPASITNLDDKIILEFRKLFDDFRIIDYFMIEFSYIHTKDIEIESFILDLEQARDEEKGYLDYLKSKVNFNVYDLYSMLLIYKRFLDNLIHIYPDKKDLFLDILKRLRRMILYTEGLNWLEMPSENCFEDVWPNNWYITPNGYLYNACFDESKRGGLDSTFEQVLNILKHSDNPSRELKSSIDELKMHIKDMKEREYVTYEEFYYYYKFARFPYVRYKSEIIFDKDTWDNIVESGLLQKLHPYGYSKCYVREICMIVIGYFNAMLCLYEKALSFYNEIKDSGNYDNLIKYVNPDESSREKILIEFYGFHRIVPNEDKVIRTTNPSINFSEYINRDWQVEHVMPIMYDSKTDSMVGNDLDKIDTNYYPHTFPEGVYVADLQKRFINKPLDKDDYPF